MIKIYLDTNIYAKLKLFENKEFMDSLVAYGEKKALFCYSQAHLNDLHQDKSEKKYGDLETIDLLCHDNFLHYDQEHDNIGSLLVHPIEAYNEFKPDDLSFASVLEGFLNPDDSENEFIRLFKSILQMQEVDLGFDKHPQYQTAEARDILSRTGITKSKYNMLEMLVVASKMMEAFETDPKLVKDIRRLSQLYLQTQKFKINIEEVNFNQRVEKTVLGKSFLSFLEEQLQNSKPKDDEITFFQRFTTAYNLISLLGFDSEKTKKVKFLNTQHDGQHAYYATVCDVVVSDDEGFKQKTKFLYNLYGIKAMVYSFEEFKRHTFLLFKNDFVSIESFTELLKHDLSHGFVVLNDKVSIKHQQLSQIIKLDHFYFAHFDRISLVRMFEDGAYYVVFYKNKDRLFYKDFCSVTNLVSKILGLDNNLMGEFNEGEMESVVDEVWPGREWTINSVIFRLLANSESKRINLVIGPLLL